MRAFGMTRCLPWVYSMTNPPWASATRRPRSVWPCPRPSVSITTEVRPHMIALPLALSPADALGGCMARLWWPVFQLDPDDAPASTLDVHLHVPELGCHAGWGLVQSAHRLPGRPRLA